jgi:branched-chain amino acid transport system substrate-binding protein
MAVLATSCGVNSSGSSAPAASASGSATVEVALEAPLSGDQASNGKDMLAGAQLAVDDLNAGGGVLGKQIRLVSADDRADPTTGVQVAQQMVARGVFAVVGPYNSAVGIKNLKTYLDAGTVVIHLTSNSATNGMGVTIQPKDYQIAPVEAKAISGFFKARTVAILFDPQTYTGGIAGQVKTALAQAGVQVVAYEKIDPKIKDYGPQIDAIANLHPDLLYVSTYYPQGAIIARDLAKARAEKMISKATCLMGLANQDPAFADAAGLDAARGCSFSGVPSPENFPKATKYVTDYTAKVGKAPGTWGTFTYDSIKLLADAVQRAGSWDRTKVSHALLSTKDYAGITGTMSIDPTNGNRVDVPVVILSLGADGKYTVDQKWAAFAGFGS